MGNHRLITPEGTKDYLFYEATARNDASRLLERIFCSHSYAQVITPCIEYLDVFLEKGHGIPVEHMYKLTDSAGRLMVLRPDSTMPIARLCATRLKDEELPIRLYYKQAVYSSTKRLSGKSSEVLQTGIELVSNKSARSSKRADIEALSIALQALEGLSPSGFRLEIGHIGLFNSLADSLFCDEEIREQVRQLIEGKNYPALNDLLDTLGQSSEADALRQLPRLFGGDEVFITARKLFHDEKSLAVLDSLQQAYSILRRMNTKGEIAVDLGIVNRTDYYTGIVFKGYIEGCLGEAVLSGGRYDNLMGGFGKALSAIGFAVNIDAAAQALGGSLKKSDSEALVYAYDGFEAEGIRCVNRLTESGKSVELSLFDTPNETLSYAKAKGISLVFLVNERETQTKAERKCYVDEQQG